VLTEEHLKTVGKEYAAEIAGIESIQEKEQAEIGQISQQLDELTKKLESYSDCEEQIRINNKRLAEIPAELKNDRKEKKKLENLLHELKLAMEMRDKKTVASEEQVQLKQVENELTLISPVMKKLSDLKDKLGTIEAADIPTKYNNITGEISQKDGVLAQITDNESQTKTAEEKLKQFQNELKQKQEQLEQGSEIFIKITDCELQKKEITKELENLRKKLIRLDQIPIELDNLGKELKKLDETKTEIDNLSNNLQKNQYALEERRTLESILANMEKLKPDIDKYSELTSRIEELETEDIVSKYSECNTEIRRKPIIIKKIGEDQKKLKDTETLLHRKDEEIQKKKKILDEGKSVFERLDSLEKRRGNEQEALGDCRESIAASISQLNGVEEKIQKINVEIKEFQKTAKSVCILEETKRWLANDLVPAINTIEKQVLANINEQFNAVFQRSFGMLIENEDISVSVNESFTPILEQDGYEIDVSALSGGEKTSVALAYRLALNTIVKQQIPSLKSSLLILDEPTDGFSSSQLYKLRDILRDTRCEQVIMVSHENELEGFVDSIYRVSKENGVSTVKA
jgi:exonuclease SbcC